MRDGARRVHVLHEVMMLAKTTHLSKEIERISSKSVRIRQITVTIGKSQTKTCGSFLTSSLTMTRQVLK